MLKLYKKIFTTPKTVIDEQSLKDQNIEIIGKKLEKYVQKLFNGSLAIREVDAGSTNACEQELTALSNA